VEKQIEIQSITRILCVPAPDLRKDNLWSFVIFAGSDSIVFTVGGDVELKIRWGISSILLEQPETYQKMAALLSELVHVPVYQENDALYRKKCFVKCYLKSKEGIIYFLKEGIFFGMKKPLQWFSADSIAKIEFANSNSDFVDLILHNRDETEIEFNFIDQNELSRIADVVMKYNHVKKRETEEKIVEIPIGTSKDPVNIHDSESGSEEGDEDFAPNADNEVPEEYDENYGILEEEEGGEGDEGDEDDSN